MPGIDYAKSQTFVNLFLSDPIDPFQPSFSIDSGANRIEKACECFSRLDKRGVGSLVGQAVSPVAVGGSLGLLPMGIHRATVAEVVAP
jgi:hypothetical protein